MGANPNALIVRTSWLYGSHGKCFPRTMIRAWDAGRALRVIADQTGCPTYTVDLSRVLVDLIERNAYPGIYHACGPTVTNWYAFAVEAITAWCSHQRIDLPIEVAAISTEEYPTPAKRPKYSVLAMDNLLAMGITPMRPLGEALADFVERLANSGL